MESSIIPIYHFFPNINKLNNQKIITDLKKHKSKIFRSHKINHRWENQYLNFHIVPEVQKIFTHIYLPPIDRKDYSYIKKKSYRKLIN